MDTSDPGISFNASGVCDHCEKFDRLSPAKWFPETGQTLWQTQIDEIRRNGRGKRYDCVIGLSGGIDSSYLAIKSKGWGLRPLLVHVDAGWNSELAVSNVEAVVKFTGYDLYTHVVEWNSMKQLQLAYLKSGISNQDVPQDHIFFSVLYSRSTKMGIRSILSGGNYATESVFPSSWHHSAMDAINLRAISKRYGSGTLKGYVTTSPWDYFIKYPLISRMKVYRPLNYMVYDRELAIAELTSRVGFKPYGRKHGESTFTKFFQNYYLPAKFGFDKRVPHLSSMVLSGLLSRNQALKLLEEPLYKPDELSRDLAFVANKLDMSVRELEDLLAVPNAHYQEFSNWDRWIDVLGKTRKLIAKLTSVAVELRY